MREKENEMCDKLRIKKAAKYYGVSESFFRHLLCEGKISSYRLGRNVYISRSEIDEIINKNVQPRK